jgi:hypothetical protein
MNEANAKKKADLIRDMVVSILKYQIEFNVRFIFRNVLYGYFRTGSDQYIGAIASEHY